MDYAPWVLFAGSVSDDRRKLGSVGPRAAPNGPGGFTRRPRNPNPMKAMNQIVQWDPFRELEDIQHRLSTLMNSGNGHRRHGKGHEWITTADWTPVVDITEDDKHYVIKAVLPEVKKEDVHVSVEHGVLTLTGERRFEKEDKGRKYHRVERAYGSFTRSFVLPENVDPKKVGAAYKDGILTVTVAKAPVAHKRAIDVKVN